jgi:Domain of unknown function (DUF1772)
LKGGAEVIELAKLLVVISVLGTAVVYGTDVFCALVQRPALVAVDDPALVAVMGNVHRFGDRRMPVPGVLGIVAAIASAALFAVAGQWTQTITAACAVVILLAWVALYVRISAPINRQLTAAAASSQVLANARVLQSNWDRVITARAILQGLALVALCLTLIV